MTQKKWYKNQNDKVVAGVLSGLMDYLGWNIDLSLVRIIYVLIALMSSGLFVILYIVAAIILPTKPTHYDNSSVIDDDDVYTHPEDEEI